MKKMIITNKFKGHMLAHQKEFIEPFENLIKEFEMSKEFQELQNDFCKITFNFNRAIGFNTVINTRLNEKVIYAKRIGREIYSKFVKREELGAIASKVVFILNKNKKAEDSYFLITMFPGEECEKQPEDKNIKDVTELEKCLNFWRNRAFIYDERLIDKSSIRYSISYEELYKKQALKGVSNCIIKKEFEEKLANHNEKLINREFELSMYVNTLSEIYNLLIWINPFMIANQAFDNLLEAGLFERFRGFDKDRADEWIDEINSIENYPIIADMLSEHRELMPVDVVFKGKGRYHAILMPDNDDKNKLRLYIMPAEDIMWYLYNTSKVCVDNVNLM